MHSLLSFCCKVDRDQVNGKTVYTFVPIFIECFFSVQFKSEVSEAGPIQPIRRLLSAPEFIDGPPANSVPCATILSFWLSSIWVRLDNFFVKYFQF